MDIHVIDRFDRIAHLDSAHARLHHARKPHLPDA